MLRRNDESPRNLVKRVKRDLEYSFLPTSMFQLKCDGRERDEKIKASKYECIIDGCSKIICVSHSSRSNAKRHVKVN